MRTVSWILLALVALVTLLGSMGSATFAYQTGPDQIGPIPLEQLSDDREVTTAIHGRRVTAASYGAAFAILMLFVVLIPYRRGDGWSWWAILVTTVIWAAMMLARIPFVGTTLGANTAAIQLGVVIVALLLDVRRLRA